MRGSHSTGILVIERWGLLNLTAVQNRKASATAQSVLFRTDISAFLLVTRDFALGELIKRLARESLSEPTGNNN